MARTTCQKCETPVRGRRLCTGCELDKTHGQGITTETDDSTTTERDVRCANADCGHEFTIESGMTPCPECGGYDYQQTDEREVLVA